MASVLVVEDDQFVRSALIRHLTDAAHTVRSVGTALEALREVAHFRFDVVILDLGLPDLDGSEALKMLRGITDVPVIIATARDDETEIVRLLNAGADDYLTKPFSVEHLSARMAAVLRRSRTATGDTPPSTVIRVGGPLPPDVDGRLGAGRRYVNGHPGVRAGRGDNPLQLLPLGGDGQRRGDRGRLPLGVGERAVARHLLDDEPERHGEGDHDHGGDRQTDLDQCPSHRGGSPPGGSSFTPTPRSVCR